MIIEINTYVNQLLAKRWNGKVKTGTLFDPSKPVNIIKLHFRAA